MGPAGRQFQALLWKNWLCRLRHPVLSLAEFFWPCILFMILTILRFQEPPRHRDTCYLQPRDLPNRGILPFVQGLLCNTGSSCRNFSFEGSLDHHFRFQATDDHKKVNSLAFLKEVQDVAKEIYETMDKAKNLQKLWVQRSEAPDSSYGSSFLTMDLNRTEEVISKLESLHKQPHIWDFLFSLPRLHTPSAHAQDGLPIIVHFLQAVLNSLTSLGDLGWLPLHQAAFQVSEIVLNVTISTLMSLQRQGASMTESVSHPSLQNMLWDPRKVQSDLKSQLGFGDLQREHILNSSAELKEVFDQWQQDGLLQEILTGITHNLGTLRDQFEEEGVPWKVAEALHTVLLLLSDGLAFYSSKHNSPSSQIFQHLWELQTVLQRLPPWPALKRLLQLNEALRHGIAQDLHFVQEILMDLETLANGSIQGGPRQWKLEKDMFFEGLKQLLMKNATATCLDGHLFEKKAPLTPRSAHVEGWAWELFCHHPAFNRTSTLHKLLSVLEDADYILQEVITGHTNVPISLLEGHLGWQDLETQLSEVSLSCSWLFQLPGSDASPGNGGSPGGCEHQLLSTVIFHILNKAQLSLEQTSYWKAFSELIRKTCEVARYVNTPGSFQKNLLAFSEDSPCYAENMDWTIISDNYFTFFNNLMKSPVTTITRALNFIKHLLVMEKKLQDLEDEQANFLLSSMEFLEELLLPNPSASFSAPEFRNLSTLTEDVLNRSVLWINHSKNLERDSHTVAAQKFLEFGKQVIKNMPPLQSHWMTKESKNILRFIELILLEINPKMLKFFLYGISKGERVKLENLSIITNFSVPEIEKILGKNLNFSHLLHSDQPKSPAMNMDFVHLIETIINNLYEFGFLRQEQVSETLDTVYAIRNASDLFSSLSEPQKQEVNRILTHIYLSVFKDKDSALLLQAYSSLYQYIYKFFSIQSSESLLTYLTQVSRYILDTIEQFNLQNISRAFAFLSETAGVLGGISELSPCQQLLSAFHLLELQAQSLVSTEGHASEVIYSTFMGLKQLLVVDEDFRIAVFQYASQLFSGSMETLWGKECFALDNESDSSADYLAAKMAPLVLPQAWILSNPSANVSVFNEFMAVHCTLSWLQMWTEIWGSISQIFKLDLNVFTPLYAGLTQLLEELENNMKISKSCQGIFPLHHTARLILNLIKNLTQANLFHDWDDFLEHRDRLVALGEVLVAVRSLNLDQVEKSFFTMEAALGQLKAFLLNTNTSREFLYSLFEVFIELSKISDYVDRDIDLINHFLSNLTDGTKFENVIIDLKETILFLRNVSHGGDLLSCADIFQNVTSLILEDGLLHVNSSQRIVHILSMLNSTFSSQNIIRSLEGCVAWIDIINHLYVMYNSSFSQGHLHSILWSFKDVEGTMNSVLKSVTWVLNRKKPLCFLNESNINCVNIYLRDMTNFLNIIFTTGLEKEKVPNFKVLLALLNDSTNRIKMIISNLTSGFDFASQANWKHFNELVLRPIEIPEEIPNQFQNIWLHLIALGKEMQKLLRDIFPNVLGKNSSANAENIFSIFSTRPKDKDINSLGDSIYHLANYIALNLSHDLQNSSEIIPHAIMKSLSLGLQLMKDVFNLIVPAVRYSISQGTGQVQVLKKVTSLIRTLKKADIDLSVAQLEQISKSLVDFFKNLRSGNDSVGVNLLIGLIKKFVDSSYSWNINHLLQLSRLLPQDSVNAVVGVYHALPHVVGLLQRIINKNITEGLKDVYSFLLLHGVSMSSITKEDSAVVIKTLLDTIELISDHPALVSEAFTCLPLVWCQNHTTSGFQQNPKLEACNIPGLMSSFYRTVASLLDHLHLSPLDEDSQCSNESSPVEISRKAVCVIHELVDWNSILLELSEAFQVNISLLKTVQGFWHKLLPFVPSSGSQSNTSIPELCPGGLIKQVAFQILGKLKNVNFTNLTTGENILAKLASLNKIFNITEGMETSVRKNIFLSLERIIKWISGDSSLENSFHYLLSPFTVFLNTSLTESSLEALSSFIKKSEAAYSFEELWLGFQQTMKGLTHDFNARHLFSEINKEIQGVNSGALQNMTLQLLHFLDILDSSSSKALDIIEEFLLVTKNWFHEQANESYMALIQALFVPMANESSTDGIMMLTKDITTYLGYLKSISREGNFDVTFLTHLLNQEQLTDFSIVQLLLENILMNPVNNLASSQEPAPNLGDTSPQIMNFINLTLNHMQSEQGWETNLLPGSIVDFMEQLLKTLFPLSLKGNSENKISILKDFYKDVIAEMSFVTNHKILEVLKLGQFLTLMNEERLMNIFSSIKKTVCHLIKSSFISDSGELYFDSHPELAFVQDLFYALLREPSMKNNTKNNLDFLTVGKQLPFRTNNSEDLFKLNQNLLSVLHLVRDSSTNLENLLDTLLNSLDKDFHTSYLALQEVVLGNLTSLLSFVNNSFLLRNIETLEIAKQLIGVISGAGEESPVLESLLEVSQTLTLLLKDCAELRDLATSVDTTVTLLRLAKKVSEQIARVFETQLISSTEDTMEFFDVLYSFMQQSAQHLVKEITALKKADQFIPEKTDDLLTLFLDLAFGMVGVKPNTSRDSDDFRFSSSILSYVNQSKDFSDIVEGIAEFLTSVKIDLGNLKHLVVTFNNGAQMFSVQSVNLWEEILDCLVPINSITKQMDFLQLNPVSTHSASQDTRQERIHEMIYFLDKMLTKSSTEILIENSTETGTHLKAVADLTLEALWNSLKTDNRDILNLLLTFSKHPHSLLNTTETSTETSSGVKSAYGDDLSKGMFFNLSLIWNITRPQVEKAILTALSRIALSRKNLFPSDSQWINNISTWLHLGFEIFLNETIRKNVMSEKEERTNPNMTDLPPSFKPSSRFEKYLKALIALIEHWQKGPWKDQSAVEMCRVLQQLEKPSEAVKMLQRVEVLALRMLTIVAESPSLMKDILCATLSCKQGGLRHLILSAIQGVTLVHGHYQEIEKIWSLPSQLNCESVSKNLSSTLENFKNNLENATHQDCMCQPLPETVQQHIRLLAESLQKTWSSRNPIVTFLSNFTVTEDVKVKDLMMNTTKLTEELQSSTRISGETIHSILEANISHSKVLSSALTVALSGKCDQNLLHLLLTFPEGEKSWFVVKELCNLPGSEVYPLLLAMSRNLNLRTFIYKTVIPSEANGLLHSLLDVISSLNSILTRAQHIFEYLPEFLHTFKITALLDMPDFEQVSQNGQARSSAFGSFQSLMKLVCKDQASFLSNSNTFVNLPRVNELLEDDKEKFNIPEGSTVYAVCLMEHLVWKAPFCLKLYEEILQSPNGALVWSFLKPILHGKILYTPNTAEINKVIQKANYTFYFVDKLKILSETLLKMSSLFQGSGQDQMFSQLQETLRNKFIRNFVESQLHIDVDKLTENLQTYGGMLDKMFKHAGAGRFQFLASVMANLSSCVALDRFQAMDAADVLELKAHELMQRNDFLASIIFNSSLVRRCVRSAALKLQPHVTYTIRTSVLYSMRTDLIKNPSWKFHPPSLPADGFKYNYIFVPLQDMIERAIIMVQSGQEALEPTTQTQAAPYPCHTSDLFLNNVGFFFPLIMMLTWMVSVASMVRKLVYEREIQIEEYLRIMGVHPVTHLLAWFLENMAVLTLSSAALAAILKVSGIFRHSDACIVFLFLLDFGVSAIMLSYFLSGFFSQANTAALCSSLVYMISFLPYIVLLVLHNQLSFVIQTILCFLSTTAFGQGVFFITFLEGQEAGIQWNNMYQAPEAGGMTFGWVCWMILFDSSLYFLCGWYFSNLVPGTFGLQKPWYFPFTMSYWKSVCGSVDTQRHSLCSHLFFSGNIGNKGLSHQNAAGELEGGPPGVVLVSVTKEYEDHKVAVQDLTLTFHRGQITALLGTNGAGKTTIISMLTGLYPPTSGTIIVNGKNLQTDLCRVRMELGLCPQQDVLLDNLTVWEHLLLFASIKAPQWTKKELQKQIHKTLDDVGLAQHQQKPIRTLSGGMKRKLSIGIAFMGASRTVVLDEPTSGVDPCSRRSLWDILLKYREGRTIIFTTHHLDEAEMLGDHVAILQQGRLKCSGPPLCLKEEYGRGLSLTLTKRPSVLGACDPQDIACVTSLIQTYIPQAFLKGTSGGELTYAIPKDADKAHFKELFRALGQNLQHLHLTGCGISDTTLEEVFLMLLQDSNKKSHVAPGTELEPQNRSPAGPSPGCCTSLAQAPPGRILPAPVRGCALLASQVAALLRKRWRGTLRTWKSTGAHLLLPVLFVALAMGLFMVQPLATSYPPLKLTPGHYERAETYFFRSGNDRGLTQVLLRTFGDQDHLCADSHPDWKNSSSGHADAYSGPEFQDACGCLKCLNRSAQAPSLTNCLGHTLLNLSGFNVEDYLLVPSEKPRLGGWSFGVRVPSEAEDGNANPSQPRTLAKVWYNQKGFHSLPSYLNHLNNLILWQHLPPALDWRRYGITLYSHPYGGALLNEDKILESIRQCGVALCIVLGFSILSASIGSSAVRDRVTGAKRLQHLSGLGHRTYWLTHFLYDMLFYLVSVCLCVTVVAAFQLSAFTFRENLAATALLLALFGYAVLPWMYLMSGIFSSSDVAFISYISLNFVFGLCTMLMTTMPRLLAIISKAQNLQKIYDVLKWVFTIFPQFCLGQGLTELCYNQIKYDLTHNFGIDSYMSPFEMNFLGWIFVELALQGTILLLLRILLHRDLLQWSRGHAVLEGTVKSIKDIDVEKEQMRVFEGRTSGDILVLNNLSKSYGSFSKKTTAVQDLSVGIRRGECFGLLGVNGAGKSTTFKMLSGEIPPSSGHVVFRTPLGDAMDLWSAGEAGVLVGYCPQQDALDEHLTGWEHLHYYCSLRGIPKDYIPEVAADLVRRLYLEAHADELVATYSGGTKRKLSTALALVGKPDILLLDEPSSGMDPCSKQYLWQTITKEVQEGCAAVLTSHSMEECEALCSRLAIMVDGTFQCLGSPQHIKSRFGDGYTVKVWLCKGANQPITVFDCLQLHFPGTQFKGQRHHLLEYHVPRRWECLGDLFRVLEDNKSLLNIKHYSINQTTLEQVFINFATEQQQTTHRPLDPTVGCRLPPHLPV